MRYPRHLNNGPADSLEVNCVLEPCSGNHKKLYEWVNHAYYATQNLITAAGVTRPPLFLVKLFLNSRRPFLINFTTKSYLHNETQIAYKFYTLYPLQLFFRG